MPDAEKGAGLFSVREIERALEAARACPARSRDQRHIARRRGHG